MANLELHGARFEFNIALDDLYMWQQRLRQFVHEAETYSPEAFEVSLRHLNCEIHRASKNAFAKLCEFQRTLREEADDRGNPLA